MKKLFAALQRAPKRTSALIAVVLGVVLVPAALFAYGPGRPTYTMEHPADHVTFDSITDNPTYGDEREFVTIKDATAGGQMTSKANLVPGHTYTVQMYVHNDASSTLNDAAHNYKGIARDTTIRAVLPTSVDGNDTVDGFLSASNATPGTVYDTAGLTSNGRVNLEYVQGSAKLHTWKQQTALSANMFGNGVKIGSGDKSGTDLSGNWNGCIDYAGTVTYEFTVKKPATPNFSVEKKVSKHGANSWNENYTAKPGETVDFRIKYANTGNVAQNNVVIKDKLPAGLTYVNGTTRLYNSETPAEGKLLSDNVTKGGVNIGNYAPNAWAYVAFSAKVAANDNLPVCGTNTLTNTATVETDNGSKSDTATVTTNKKCETPKKPGVSITKTVDGVKNKEEKVGKNFEYELTVKNTGDVDLKNVKVSDAAPAGVTFVSADKGSISDNKWNYTVPSLKVGQSQTFKITAVIKEYKAGDIKNTACVDATEVPGSPDDCDNATVHVPKPPVETVPACNTETGVIEQVEKGKENTAPYTTDLSKCEKVKVCNTETGKTVTVTKDKENTPPYSTDFSKCTEQPVTPPSTPTTPTELPHTGASDVILSLAGAGSLIAAISYYVASRRALNN